MNRKPRILGVAGRCERGLFLIWLIYASVLSFGVFVSLYRGDLQILYATDKSRICWVITFIFLAISVHAARRIFLLSAELDSAAIVRSILDVWPAPALKRDAAGLRAGSGGLLPDCILSAYLGDVLERRNRIAPSGSENASESSDLTEVYRHRVKDPNELGWFMADMMIKLGLLGTIVGFVMMLASVTNVSDFSAGAMQGVLKSMSVGMGTALYTTFAGLVCSILTTAQYYLLDQAADNLLGTAMHLAQTRVISAQPASAG